MSKLLISKTRVEISGRPTTFSALFRCYKGGLLKEEKSITEYELGDLEKSPKLLGRNECQKELSELLSV